MRATPAARARLAAPRTSPFLPPSRLTTDSAFVLSTSVSASNASLLRRRSPSSVGNLEAGAC